MTPQDFKAWRKRLGLTQERAGLALGKNRRTIAAYEGAANWRGNRIEIPLAVALACKWLESTVAQQDKRALRRDRYFKKLGAASVTEDK